MSRGCRHISEAVQPRAQYATLRVVRVGVATVDVATLLLLLGLAGAHALEDPLAVEVVDGA
jgi:hypothetical protein